MPDFISDSIAGLALHLGTRGQAGGAAIALILCLAMYKPVLSFIFYLLNKNYRTARKGAWFACIVWGIAWALIFLGQPAILAFDPLMKFNVVLAAALFLTLTDGVVLYLARH